MYSDLIRKCEAGGEKQEAGNKVARDLEYRMRNYKLLRVEN